MKRILCPLLLAVLFIFIISCSSAVSKKNVASEIQKKYPGAEILEFEKEKTGFEVEFIFQDQKYEAEFDKRGKWLLTEQQISFSELPENIIQELQAEYHNWEIDEIEIIEKAGAAEKMFSIELELDEKKNSLVYTYNGGFMQGETVANTIINAEIDMSEYKDIDNAYYKKSIPYSLLSPDTKMEMPPELFEISGIKIVDDNTVACIQDELGIIYFYNLKEKHVAGLSTFAGAGDYEGITTNDNGFIVLRSDAKLFAVRDIKQPEPVVAEYKLNIPFVNNEGLFFDAVNNRLLIASKSQMINDKNINDRYLHLFVNADDKFSREKTIKLDYNQIKEKLPAGSGNFKFNPSALAVHPLTGEIYVLSANHRLLVVCGRQGAILSAHLLHPDLFNKPEGIAFFSNGDMLISNEGNKKKKAPAPGNILRFNYQK